MIETPEFATALDSRLPLFEVRQDTPGDAFYLFNPYSGKSPYRVKGRIIYSTRLHEVGAFWNVGGTAGETIFGVNTIEDLGKIKRFDSLWRPPERSQQEYREAQRQVLQTATVKSPGEGQGNPMGQLEATQRIQKFMRRLLAIFRMSRRIKDIFEKRFDSASGNDPILLQETSPNGACWRKQFGRGVAGFYYYYNKQSQASQWHRPLGLHPMKDLECADESQQDQYDDGEPVTVHKRAKPKSLIKWGRTPDIQAYIQARYQAGKFYIITVSRPKTNPYA